MNKVLLYSLLLVAGLVGSQFLPGIFQEQAASVQKGVTLLTMVALAFIMIHVGYEFEIDKANLRPFGWDYVVAMTAATFPWILAAVYFLIVLLPPGSFESWDAWKDALLTGRFAAPTSAGVLFSMLAAAGLSATWVFRKARVLAIFDDLDTVLLMIPLKMMMVGLAWQLGLVVVFMVVLLWLAWRFLHKVSIPVTWPWVLGYAFGIVLLCEVIYQGSKLVDHSLPIHLEVLLPAFVLGCMMKRPAGSDPHRDDAREGHQEGPEFESEQRASTIISAIFMVLVGLNLPALFGGAAERGPQLGWGEIMGHVFLVTILINLGKMFPAFCYRREAHWRERLAVAIGMWPRGEVGAGVLAVSLSYGIGGDMVTVAVLSLALNLLLTGVFIYLVKRLLAGVPVAFAAPPLVVAKPGESPQFGKS
jgi:Kef-type K+ transport system membrane component KefB